MDPLTLICCVALGVWLAQEWARPWQPLPGPPLTRGEWLRAGTWLLVFAFYGCLAVAGGVWWISR